MQAIEVTGSIDEQGNLSLDQPLQIESKRVRVILLIEEDDALEPAIEGFRQGWQDAMTGNTIPIEQVWDALDAL